MIEGLILRGVGGAYWVREASGEVTAAKPRGIFRKRQHSPLPGDRVRCTASGDDDFPYTIEAIEPRRNSLVRPPIANLERCFLTFAVREPNPDLLLLDKLGVICAVHDIEPIIVWTKRDLDDGLLEGYRESYEATGWTMLESSEEAPPSDQLRALIDGHLVSFAGPSGAGKSTLTNAILGSDYMPLGEVSEKLGRGRHTTRHVELIPCGSGWVADTPGFTSLEFEQLGLFPEEVGWGYPEFQVLAHDCRFLGCRHLQEPDCAVRGAVEAEPARYEARYLRYQQLREALEAVPEHVLRRQRAKLPPPGLSEHRDQA